MHFDLSTHYVLSHGLRGNLVLQSAMPLRDESFSFLVFADSDSWNPGFPLEILVQTVDWPRAVTERETHNYIGKT